MRLLSMNAAARHREKLTLLNFRNKQKLRYIDSNVKSSGFQLTRRLIALTAVFFVIAFPKLIAIFRPDLPISIGSTQLSEGFWIFSSSCEKVKWSKLSGLVITPLDTHLLSAIIGLYFGSSLVEGN